MIQLQDVFVSFHHGLPIENRALMGVNLSIEQGEFVTVIGTNGAGKSTLLNTISGAVMSDRGKIVIDGVDVTHQHTAKRAKLVARVFQDPRVGTCENLTIEENLALANQRGLVRQLKAALNPSCRTIFQQKLTGLSLGLENRLKDPVGLLSGGQRQALSLLMASLRPSKILLLDEHTAALDPKTAQFVLALTDRIVRENNLTALMVTHSMQQAIVHGSRTIMLHQGQIVLDVSGDERRGMNVADLLALFEKTRGEKACDDSLILG